MPPQTSSSYPPRFVLSGANLDDYKSPHPTRISPVSALCTPAGLGREGGGWVMCIGLGWGGWYWGWGIGGGVGGGWGGEEGGRWGWGGVCRGVAVGRRDGLNGGRGGA